MLVISCLKGVFGAASMAGNLLVIHSESVAGTNNNTRLTGSTFIDACAKLGDASLRLTAVAMHSATEAALKKLDLIDFLPDSEGKPSLAVFQGRRVIVDDTLPTRAGTTHWPSICGVQYRMRYFWHLQKRHVSISDYPPSLRYTYPSLIRLSLTTSVGDFTHLNPALRGQVR